MATSAELIRVEHVIKEYNHGAVKALNDCSLSIKKGEVVAIIGPSGSGKSTMLRCATMLETIDDGEIIYLGDKAAFSKDGHAVYAKSADLKKIHSYYGLVFQNFNLFPHFTVLQNVTDALISVQKRPKEEALARGRELLAKMGLADKEDMVPCELSGGQQQRVALARAIVIHPQVLLMDEPLSNLDAKLRVEMRNAIKLIQQKIGITTVYVTHDQEEALAVSDRIAIMNNGIIQQIGTPKEIYQRPNCVFVATFIGLSNILEAKVKITGAAKILDFGAYEVPMDNLIPEISAGSKVLVSVRPEEFEICLNGSDGLTAVVEHSVFLGVTTHYFMRLENGQEIEVIQNSGVEDTIPNKTTVRLLVQPAKINVFTEDGNTPLIVRGNR